MKFQGFNIDDFTTLRNVKKFNKKHYKHLPVIIKGKHRLWWKYKSTKLQHEARNMNRLVFNKLSALMYSINEDLRFKNFKIEMCSPKALPGNGKLGEYRSYLWFSMVDKKWLEKTTGKLSNKKIPKTYLPQIQVGISSEGFKTAEIFFEVQAIKHFDKFNDYLYKNYNWDNSIYLHCEKRGIKKSICEVIGTRKNYDIFRRKFISNECNQVAVYRHEEPETTDINKNLTDQVLKDLLYIIKEYYEPVFGKILYNRGSGKKGNKRKVDPEKRMEVESKAYHVVTKHFEERQYDVVSVAKDNVGWDLEAVGNGEKLLLEVKGLSGPEVNVELTPNEYKKLKENRKNYRVCVVTNALVEPKLYIYSYKNNNWMDQYGIILKTEIRKALKMYWEK